MINLSTDHFNRKILIYNNNLLFCLLNEKADDYKTLLYFNSVYIESIKILHFQITNEIDVCINTLEERKISLMRYHNYQALLTQY